MAVTAAHGCSGNHIWRLLIGEGNFSYAEALIDRHDKKANHDAAHSLAHRIIATELKTEIICEQCFSLRKEAQLNASLEKLNIKDGQENSEINVSNIFCEECKKTQKRIETLKAKGVNIIFGFDGRQIHDFAGNEKIERVHWNVPHHGGNTQNQIIPKLVRDFFASCGKAQLPGHRVYITIPQPHNFKDKYWQGYVYDITTAVTLAGYRIIKKRKFMSRYPGYKHLRTNLNENSPAVNEGAREFVFEKIDPEEFQILLKHFEKQDDKEISLTRKLTKLSSKKCKVQRGIVNSSDNTVRAYYECSTDEDSSDYEEK